MNVLYNRSIDDVIVLGSGQSISKLTSEEIDYINRCKTVIALNKFMAFYKVSGIIPTHIFFLDKHDNSLIILEHILNVCNNDKLKNLTFVLHRDIEYLTYTSYRGLFKVWIKHNLKIIKHILKNKEADSILKGIAGKFTKFRIPPSSSISFFTTHRWLEGGIWARDTSMKLYHYRGSLTSILNYVTLIKPKKDVYLVGNDFNSNKYFFQKELDSLKIDSKDWTTPIVEKHKKHFSVIGYEGKTIYDKLPFIIDRMIESQNHLYCTNPESLLVIEGNLVYKGLPI
jgi:hypothetical protein